MATITQVIREEVFTNLFDLLHYTSKYLYIHRTIVLTLFN